MQLQHLSLPRQIRNVAGGIWVPAATPDRGITESAIVNNLERARTIATELREMGCKLALDDFGTGYSTLTQLQALTFSALKSIAALSNI